MDLNRHGSTPLAQTFHEDGLVILLILRHLRQQRIGMQTQRGLPQHLVDLAAPGHENGTEEAAESCKSVQEIKLEIASKLGSILATSRPHLGSSSHVWTVI